MSVRTCDHITYTRPQRSGTSEMSIRTCGIIHIQDHRSGYHNIHAKEAYLHLHFSPARNRQCKRGPCPPHGRTVMTFHARQLIMYNFYCFSFFWSELMYNNFPSGLEEELCTRNDLLGSEAHQVWEISRLELLDVVPSNLATFYRQRSQVLHHSEVSQPSSSYSGIGHV